MANEKKFKDEEMTEIVVATILSNRTKLGMVEFEITTEGKTVKTQWDIRKARHIRDMLSEAIEAAVSDSLIYKFLHEKVGLKEDAAIMAVADFREIRQGSSSIIDPN